MNQSKPLDLNAFKTTLKRHSLKATPQRIAVHEAMMKLGHASADMVVAEIQASGGVTVTAASVYNILSQLALMGIYSHRLSATNKMFFDVNTWNHAHVYDCENHSYKDLMDPELMDLVHKHLGRKKFRGYTVENIDIQIVVRPTKRRGVRV